VDCKVKASTIVNPYSSYDEIVTFEIVASDTHGYYLYVPHYYFLKETKKADAFQCRSLGIDKKFIDENVVYIQEKMIAYVHAKQEGVYCKICEEFCRYAESNQKDGTFICFSCRQNPYR
jgi:hypothetical protein